MFCLYYIFFLFLACALFNIVNKNNVCVVVNDCEIVENDFEKIILQYYKLSTFVIEIKDTGKHIYTTKAEYLSSLKIFPQYYLNFQMIVEI